MKVEVSMQLVLSYNYYAMFSMHTMEYPTCHFKENTSRIFHDCITTCILSHTIDNTNEYILCVMERNCFLIGCIFYGMWI